MPSRIQQATLGSISEILASNRIVVIDFWANWCRPCHAMAPILRKVAKEFEDQVAFAKVNIDIDRDLASQFKIRSVPTLVLFKDGKEWNRFTGIRNHSEMKKMVGTILH